MTKLLALMSAAATAAVLAACSANADTDSTGTPPATSAAPSRAPSTSIASPKDSEAAPNAGTPITITAGDRTITATLNNSDVARDFAAMLPVTLPWFRNLDIEYITELPAPMTETGPFYTDVQAGDLVYYNPLDSITIIYSPTSSVPTLTKMGEITSDLTVFRNLPDSVNVRIEAVYRAAECRGEKRLVSAAPDPPAVSRAEACSR